MATKPRKPAAAGAPTPAPAPAPEADQARQNTSPANVWLAGMGALASAQAEGNRAFEALVKQGMAMQNETQELAKQRMAEAAQLVEAMAQQAGAGGVAPWNRLGGIFEDRVAQAMARMGMPTAQELAALTARVEALERQLAQARSTTDGAGAKKTAPASKKKA